MFLKRTRRTAALVAVAVTTALTAVACTPPTNPAADSNVVASTVPYAYTPNFQNGAVESIAQVGNRLLVGGSFTTVTSVPKPGSGSASTQTRPYLTAFDPTTGVLDPGFRPVVNGEVDAIQTSANGAGVYAAGKFTTAGGVSERIALFNVHNGQLVTTFRPVVNGIIKSLVLQGTHLLIGGYFTAVGGQARNGLASINATTGAVEPYFAIQLSGHHNFGKIAGAIQSPVGATAIALSPDGSRAIVGGNFNHATDSTNKTGYARDQIVSIRMTTALPTVDPNWNTNAFAPACFYRSFDSYTQDIAWAPDGSYFVVASTGGYTRGTFDSCDAATRFDASATGQNVPRAWVNDTGTDSIYSVYVTKAAVYVGGHMRWLNNPYGQDSPASGAVPRPSIAALDPVNGEPLGWNPGRNPRGHGAEVIYGTATGIWVGSDTDCVGAGSGSGCSGSRVYLRQKLAFFPYAGGRAVVGDNAGRPGIVFKAGTWTNSADNRLAANNFNPATGSGGAITSPSNGGGITWSQVRGAFMLNGRVWYGKSDGKFYYRTFDGRNFGPELLVDPYNDPYWSGVQTGSGGAQTYQGTVTSFYSEIPNITGMFYANRSIYYTLSGDGRLFRRAFSPDTAGTPSSTQVTGGVISPQRITVSDPNHGGLVNFSAAAGMFVSNGSLWNASRFSGRLYRASWSGSNVTSRSVQDTRAGGSWTGRGVFLTP